jgi:AcrR family transcriptional regulator
MGSVKPRPYRLQQRQAGVDETRSRIVAAARRVLGSRDSFSIDAVAREAGVARLTVYDRFGTREGLLDVVFDDLAESGGLTRLPEAFTEADPVAGLERFVAIFCGFYAAHRPVLRRLHALEVLGRGVSAETDRNSRRLQGLRVLLGRVAEEGHTSAGTEDVAHTVHALTSFAFIDELSGADAEPLDIAPRIVALVRVAAHLDPV